MDRKKDVINRLEHWRDVAKCQCAHPEAEGFCIPHDLQDAIDLIEQKPPNGRRGTIILDTIDISSIKPKLE